MITEKMRRLAAGYKEGTKAFMESYRLRSTAPPLCGEITFCPYCGTRTIDAGPTRTYCTTCGEDVATPEQVENLHHLLNKAEHDRDSWQEDCEKAEHARDKALADLEKFLNAENVLLTDCKVVLESIIACPAASPAKILERVLDVHRRLP